MGSGSEGSQPQFHVVSEPDGFSGSVGSLLARSDGSSEVAEVVSDLKRNGDILILFFLRDHFDKETNLVGFPEGNNTVEKTEISGGVRCFLMALLLKSKRGFVY